MPEQSSFGAYITPSEEGVRIFARAGFHWTATLTSAEYLANWGAVEPKKGNTNGTTQKSTCSGVTASR